MITNEYFIKALLNDEEFSEKLIILYDELYLEKIKIKEIRDRQEKIHKSFNQVRNKIIKYLFTMNCKYNFMSFLPIERYNYFISEVESYVYGLRIVNELGKLMKD